MKKNDKPAKRGRGTAGKKGKKNYLINAGEKQPFVIDEYRDTVFRILYRDDKKRQLELYNSVSGKNYTEEEELQVVTLKHAIYMGMKNDLAFLISDEVHLYEHQSTINPNMPLLELKVLVLNINPGQNVEFLEQCSTLREYMEYVARVRKYRCAMNLREAVSHAVDECIEEGILEDFLRKNKAEVVAMSIFEYDEKKVIDYIRMEEREEGKREGRMEGRREGKDEEAQKYSQLIIRLSNEGKGDMVIEAARDDDLREKLFEEYGL